MPAQSLMQFPALTGVVCAKDDVAIGVVVVGVVAVDGADIVVVVTGLSVQVDENSSHNFSLLSHFKEAGHARLNMCPL